MNYITTWQYKLVSSDCHHKVLKSVQQTASPSWLDIFNLSLKRGALQWLPLEGLWEKRQKVKNTGFLFNVNCALLMHLCHCNGSCASIEAALFADHILGIWNANTQLHSYPPPSHQCLKCLQGTYVQQQYFSTYFM